MTDSSTSNSTTSTSSSMDYFKESEKKMMFNPGSYIPNTDSLSSLSDDDPFNSESDVDMESVDLEGERKEVPQNKDNDTHPEEEENDPGCCKSCLLTCFSPCAMIAIVGGLGCYFCCNRS